MKNTLGRRVSGFVILLALASGIPMHAQKAEGKTSSLTVPVAGNNGFTGTATINRFEARGNQIVAIGFVRSSSGTSFAGVVWNVAINANPATLTATSGPARASAQLTRIAWSPGQGNSARLVPVQSTSCGVLNISLGATTVNLAGASVSLMPIGLDVSGQSGTPVGGLVCSALNLLGNVSSLVNLLNSLLGTLTGVLGGVTGGLGGVGGATGGL
jgi:hypothetical protein